MKIQWLVMFVLSVSIACSSSRKQEKSDTMTDEEYGEAMAEQHAGETPEPSGAEGQEAGEVETTSEEVAYGTLEGEEITGYFATPTTEGPHPGVILIHEWWGLNDNIRTMADKLASQGYAAIAVDMYGGQVATSPEEAKKYMGEAMSKPRKGVQNLELARVFLEEKGSPKIGVVGWCFGGSWSLRAGLTQGDEIDAVVIYYGRLETSEEKLAELRAPVLGIFGAEDEGIPVEQVKKFEAALAATDKEATIHVYDGAGHAFANPSGERYVEEAANDAWEKTLAFFDEHLKN